MTIYGFVIFVVIAAVLLLLYFLPLLTALLRDHQKAFEIFMLTLFLGWTVIGWIAALVWSFSHVQPRLVERR